jgi:hypothetical protein
MAADAAFEALTQRVVVDAARAAAYARETGLPPRPDTAPLAYPAIWLTEPQIYDAVQRICLESDCVPVHEQQRFFYDAPLRAGQTYDLEVAMRREPTPPRLHIEARIQTPDGRAVGRVETILRLVPRTLLKQGPNS